MIRVKKVHKYLLLICVTFSFYCLRIFLQFNSDIDEENQQLQANRKLPDQQQSNYKMLQAQHRPCKYSLIIYSGFVVL